jgi:hypothetical protein
MIAQMLGHSSTQIVPRYARVMGENRLDAMKKLEELKKSVSSMTNIGTQNEKPQPDETSGVRQKILGSNMIWPIAGDCENALRIYYEGRREEMCDDGQIWLDFDEVCGMKNERMWSRVITNLCRVPHIRASETSTQIGQMI